MNFREISPERKELAQKILLYSRRYITQYAPIMLTPIYALREEASPIPGPLATDGIRLWYDPERVIQDFKADREAPARQLLHVTLHCLLGHLSLRDMTPSTQMFDVAADWKVNRFMYALHNKLGYPGPDLETDRLSLLQTIEYLKSKKKARKKLVKTLLHQQLIQDDHDRWHPKEVQVSVTAGGGGSEGEPRNGTGTPQDGGSGGGEEGPDWAEMLRQMGGQSKSGNYGALAGLLQAELEPAEENGISYEQFLRRFAAPQERLLLDPDSFDIRWYCLGLEQYGDIPILEPSELSEPPAPDDLVIAIDTSGSCSGEVCRRFLRETLSLLRDISAGAASFRVLLVQCDTVIRQEMLLESADQVDRLFEEFKPGGFGGTDFRPVFDLVARRQADGSMPRVRGLLYLSDGCGDFPRKAPDYPVTFLMPETDCFFGFGPPEWVTTLKLSTNDFTLKEANT